MSGTPGSSSSPQQDGVGDEDARVRLLEEKRTFLAAVIRDLSPVGFVETRSASRIAMLLWRLKRISRIDVGYLLLECSRKRRERITTILEKAKNQKSAKIDEELAQEIRHFVKEQGLSISFDAKGNAKPQAGRPPEYAMLETILEHEKDWLHSLEFELKQNQFARKTRLEIEAIDASRKATAELREQLTKLHGKANPATGGLAATTSSSSPLVLRPPAPGDVVGGTPPAPARIAPIKIDEGLLKGMPDWFKDAFFDFGENELDPFENDMAPEDYETDGIDKVDDDLGEFGFPEPDAS
jgi:hypothetical protein